MLDSHDFTDISEILMGFNCLQLTFWPFYGTKFVLCFFSLFND